MLIVYDKIQTFQKYNRIRLHVYVYIRTKYVIKLVGDSFKNIRIRIKKKPYSENRNKTRSAE